MRFQPTDHQQGITTITQLVSCDWGTQKTLQCLSAMLD